MAQQVIGQDTGHHCLADWDGADADAADAAAAAFLLVVAISTCTCSLMAASMVAWDSCVAVRRAAEAQVIGVAAAVEALAPEPALTAVARVH